MFKDPPVFDPGGIHAAQKFALFGRWCLRELRNYLGSDIDGGDAQDMAKRIGLLREVEVSEPCGEDCPCAEYHGEFPVQCLRSVFPLDTGVDPLPDGRGPIESHPKGTE